MTEVRTASKQDYEALISMLDNVFFLEDKEEPPRNFMTLLPKLYKAPYAPWEHNYCVYEDGVPKAAVGMYVSEVSMAGVTMRKGGIGNVAVARDSRSKGYMKLAMDAAMAAMQAAGCVYGELGGQRQRYQYWGFERCGAVAEAQYIKQNLRHAFGKRDIAPGWRAQVLRAEDTAALAAVQAFFEAMPLHVRHDSAAFHDILCSWEETPYAVWQGETLEGFFTLSRDRKEIHQLFLRSVDSLEMTLRCAFAVLPEEGNCIKLQIPLWEKALLAKAEETAECWKLDDAGMVTVFSWQALLPALLQLQCQCRPLPEGELTVGISGNGGKETLRIAVTGGVPRVESFSGTPARSLTHLEALRYFLAPITCLRDPLANAWFPLPLVTFGFDMV